jgi:hypothetical protein
MSSFSPAPPGDAPQEQGSRQASLSASSQASSSDLRRTSRLSSTAGIFDLDDETIDHTTRRQSNPRVSSLGSSSHHGSMAERGSRDLFDVLEEDANPPSASAAPTSDPSSSAAPAPTTRSSRRSDGDSFGKCAPASFAA